MKKSIISLIVMILILSMGICSYAYSNDEYSIDVPEGYEEVSNGVFQSEDGYGFNIQETAFPEDMGDPYTQEELDKLVNDLYKGVEDYREEMVKSLKQTYGNSVSDLQLRQYVNSFKCNSVDLKEITKCTKNNYKCFHIIANYTMGDYTYYCDQYAIVSGSKIYTLTVSAENKEDFENERLKEIVNSFTLKNYKEPKDTTTSVLIYVGIGAGVGALIGLVSYFINKSKKQKTL